MNVVYYNYLKYQNIYSLLINQVVICPVNLKNENKGCNINGEQSKNLVTLMSN